MSGHISFGVFLRDSRQSLSTIDPSPGPPTRGRYQKASSATCAFAASNLGENGELHSAGGTRHGGDCGVGNVGGGGSG